MARQKKKLSPAWLHRVFEGYLARYETNTAHARRVMRRRIDKTLAKREGDRDELREHLETLISKYQRLGIIDDSRYASGKVRVMLGRGNSERAIRAKLMMRGVSSDLIDDALTLQRAETGITELTAAARYARRRRLGPYRRTGRADNDRRDLGRLARAGYSFSIARKILDFPTVEALEEEAGLI